MIIIRKVIRIRRNERPKWIHQLNKGEVTWIEWKRNSSWIHKWVTKFEQTIMFLRMNSRQWLLVQCHIYDFNTHLICLGSVWLCLYILLCNYLFHIGYWFNSWVSCCDYSYCYPIDDSLMVVRMCRSSVVTQLE